MPNLPMQKREKSIHTWRQFTAEFRLKKRKLLKTLDNFQDAVLVTGCQRSGTTMLTRIISQSDGMVNFWSGKDDELDGALLLAGYNIPPKPGRYCFQTTYVDECYYEYYEHKGNYKIIWLLRNPFSVVYSLLYHWPPTALDGTFQKCAAGGLKGLDASLYHLIGLKSIGRVRRACELYKAKTLQLLELFDAFGTEKMLIVDYDELVLHKKSVLPEIYQNIQLKYDPAYQFKINQGSLNKRQRLTRQENKIIQQHAQPLYEEALLLKNGRAIW